MNSHTTASLVMGATSGVASSILQDPNASSLAPMLVPLVSATIGAVFSYAVLKTTVQVMERDMRQVRQDLSQVYDLIREASIKIARIEGELERER